MFSHPILLVSVVSLEFFPQGETFSSSTRPWSLLPITPIGCGHQFWSLNFSLPRHSFCRNIELDPSSSKEQACTFSGRASSKLSGRSSSPCDGSSRVLWPWSWHCCVWYVCWPANTITSCALPPLGDEEECLSLLSYRWRQWLRLGRGANPYWNIGSSVFHSICTVGGFWSAWSCNFPWSFDIDSRIVLERR